MQTPYKADYVFHASAFALGGQITRPFNELLEVQAATTLPGTGGYSSAHADHYRYRDLISFDRAYSVVTGSSGSQTHETLVSVVVEGLNIMNMVTADRVVGRLTSSYAKSTDDAKPAQPRQLPVGSYFVNLRIAGKEVDLTSPDDIQCQGTFAGLSGKVKLSHKHARYPRASIFDQPANFYTGTPPANAPIQIEAGCAIRIEGFGRILLGHYIMSVNSRDLTMVLCELGCPVKGRLEVCKLLVNGIWP